MEEGRTINRQDVCTHSPGKEGPCTGPFSRAKVHGRNSLGEFVLESFPPTRMSFFSYLNKDSRAGQHMTTRKRDSEAESISLDSMYSRSHNVFHVPDK